MCGCAISGGDTLHIRIYIRSGTTGPRARFSLDALLNLAKVFLSLAERHEGPKSRQQQKTSRG